MKKVLSVQDLSCMGKCSLTVALPILSCMGISCSVLPTAVLSTHTGFPEPYRQPMDITAMADHWTAVGAEFDGVGVGYLANPQQAEAVEGILEKFPVFTVIDPAMGDHGRVYKGLPPEQVAAMARLCRRGDVLLPNVTEAALLTGLPYREQADMAYLQELTEGMLSFGAKGVVITGLCWDEGHTGFVGSHRDLGFFTYKAPRIPRNLHGTGDMFAAVCTGALTLGQNLYAAAKLAAGFVERVVDSTETITPYGGEFESQLPWLWQNKESKPEGL